MGDYELNAESKFIFNRLTALAYSTASELDETMAYDKMGNITSLKRGPVQP